jgi:hypothetical protein
VAIVTRKTGFVPGLTAIEDTSFQQRFPASSTALGELVLKARGAEEVVFLRHKATGSYLLAAKFTLEALLMPVVAVVFQS